MEMEYFTGYGEEPAWDERRFMLSLLAANERMGVALAYLYQVFPDARAMVAAYLEDYPFTFEEVDE